MITTITTRLALGEGCSHPFLGRKRAQLFIPLRPWITLLKAQDWMVDVQDCQEMIMQCLIIVQIPYNWKICVKNSHSEHIKVLENTNNVVRF